MAALFEPTIRLDQGKLDLRRGAIVRGEERVALTTKEVELLRYLVARASRDVTREELLTDVWGYAATTVTRAVDTAVKRLRKKLELDPAAPTHLLSVHGVGYRFEASDREPTLVPRPARPPPSPPAPDVPADGDRFFGRREELDAVRGAFRGGQRLVTLRGPAGVGKSRLGREIARSLGRPVAYMSLAGIGGDAVRGALAKALGAGREDDVALVEALRARGLLLLFLDDADGALDQVAIPTRAVLKACPDLQVLVAARAPLDVPEERVVTLAPLPRDEAVALFLDRAGGSLDAADPELLALVGALDRLPLALELAAPRARVMSPAELRSRLDQRFRVLARRRGSLRPGLEEAIGFSWDLLDADERAVLEGCSVFRGGFSAEAAEAVAEPEDLGAWVIDLLESLEAQSMIHRRALPGGGSRLDLLESVRAFAEDKARQSGRSAPASARHRAFYVALGEQLLDALHGPDVAKASGRMGLERRNLVAAWEDAPSGAERGRLAVVLGTQGMHASTVEETAAILQATELAGLAPSLEAALRVARATTWRGQNQFVEARREAEAASTLAAASVDTDLWVDAQRLLAGLDADEGDLAAAIVRLHAVRAEAPAEPTPARLRLLAREALCRFHHGEVDASERLITELLSGAIARKSPWHEFEAYRLRAGLKLRRSRLDEARAEAEQARSGFAGIGDQWRVALCHELLGAIASFGGRHATAESQHAEAVRLYRQMGRRHELPRALGNLARAQVHQGELLAARASADQAMVVAQEHGSWRALEETAMLGGTIALAEERWGEAEAHFAVGIEQAESVGEPGVAAVAYAARAFARMLQGRPEMAAPDNVRARATFSETGDALSSAFHLGLAAVIEADRGDAGAAAAFLAQGRAVPGLKHRELDLWLATCGAIVRGPTADDVTGIQRRLEAENGSAFLRALAGHLSRHVDRGG